MSLRTDYELQAVPFPEYPRPQEERKAWQNLNGKWDFAKAKIGQQPQSYGEILVPYSPESTLSGVEQGFVLAKDEMLFYKRKFVVEIGKNERVLLHFGAVDSACEVFVNKEKVGAHECGFTAFSFDITSSVKSGENEIEVRVTDNFMHGAKGKQKDDRGQIWYTAQSGIWQTVWLECVPENYIRALRYDIDDSTKTVKISASSNGEMQTFRVFDDGKEIATAQGKESVEIAYDYEFWSPENPKLYEVIITNESGDEIKSYFGYRTFGEGKDEKGKKRLLLNGKPYFYSGVLDQGYWPDGLLTPPSDKAMQDDLVMLKKMGFNTVRKHIKIEPMRWYYYCDKLGFAVWQDFVNGGSEYKFTHIALMPFLGFKHKDNDYEYFARENEKGRAEFWQMAQDTVNLLYNCPCISMWVIFNEGWGQFDSYDFTLRVQKLDSSRVIDSVSGWHDQGKDKTTLKSLHTYYTPLKVPKDERTVVLSEFGGYSMKISGHVFDESKEFGYKKFKTKAELTMAIKKLFDEKLRPLIKKGLSASIYTQVSDVEEEINGLVTYDRKIVKIDYEVMKELNDNLYKELQG